ncbi:MAG: hypothetical protein Q4C22_07125, partial [Bacillota bacterium]|nr:hypothetical protein [Bacillota bacterium]
MKRRSFKPVALMALVMVMSLALVLSGCAGGNADIQAGVSGEVAKVAQAHCLSIDVNPSLSLIYNDEGAVTEAKAFNEEGQAILAGLELEGKDIDEASQRILIALKDAGYFAESRDMLLSVDDSPVSKEALGHLSGYLAQFIADNGLAINAVYQVMDLDDDQIQAAHEMGISAGRYNLASKIAGSEEQAAIEQVAKETPVAQLVQNQSAGLHYTDYGLTDYGVTDYDDTDYGPNA